MGEFLDSEGYGQEMDHGSEGMDAGSMCISISISSPGILLISLVLLQIWLALTRGDPIVQ